MDCKTCGNNLQLKYCPACGEQKFDKHQLSVKHFIEETFEGFSHFDTKFFRSVKTLLFKPGQLSLDYTEGRRVKYMKPIQLFLVINLIFFLLPFGNMFSLTLDNYVGFKPFTNYHTKEIVKHEMETKKLSYSEYKQVFDTKIKSVSKQLIFLYIPFYGLVFALLLFGYKKYFVEHMVFATHFCSFIIVLSLVAVNLILLPYQYISKKYSADADHMFTLIFGVGLVVYAWFAIRKFYKPHWLWATLIALSLGYSFFMLIQYYRMALFWLLTMAH